MGVVAFARMTSFPDNRSEIFDEAVAVLAAFGSGIEAENTDPWLILPKHVDNGRPVGIMAMRHLAAVSPCGVKIGPYSRRTTFLWVAPVLAIVEPTQSTSVRRANIYRFPPGFGLESCQSVEDLPKSDGIILEGTDAWSQVEELFTAIEGD